MFDFHEKRKIRAILYSKATIVVLAVIVFFLSASTYERFTIEREMAARLDDKRQELNVLKNRLDVLGSNVEHLKNERGVEEELRSRFDAIKEGEQVVIIIDEAKKGEDNTADAVNSLASKPVATTDADVSVLQKVKSWFSRE